ncbi:hypothetical protein [Microbulbifer rhizosphaerae]|uniref:Uncharacterized protein n=1 Tax=Microbulbifer rhizosphaerae TaxID=1562603 RepID=A0A7W4WAY9_9GAMM|nr:hypothetical protein [Microbulbifer rhizosphaerae]MBB3060729.1 hypothetical protein [Microbulbifer rhizosphaerae]
MPDPSDGLVVQRMLQAAPEAETEVPAIEAADSISCPHSLPVFGKFHYVSTIREFTIPAGSPCRRLNLDIQAQYESDTRCERCPREYYFSLDATGYRLPASQLRMEGGRCLPYEQHTNPAQGTLSIPIGPGKHTFFFQSAAPNKEAVNRCKLTLGGHIDIDR